MKKSTLFAFVLLGLVGRTFEGDCLDVQEHDQCHLYDTFCYKLRSKEFNCPDHKPYHCAWSPMFSKYVEVCTEKVQCNKGKEALIDFTPESQGLRPHVRCEWCRDPKWYNPRESVWSNEIDHCPNYKSDCSASNYKVPCDYESETDVYTSDLLCRCDVRRRYRIARQFDPNQSSCIVDDGFICMKARSCSPDEDVLIQGYQCAPKCPAGESRTDEKSDDCIPVSTTAAPTTHPPPATAEAEVDNVTTATTTTTTAKPTTRDGTSQPPTPRQDSTSPPSQQKDSSIRLTDWFKGGGVAVCVLGISGVIIFIWIRYRKKKRKNKEKKTVDPENGIEKVPLTKSSSPSNETPVQDGAVGGKPNGVQTTTYIIKAENYFNIEGSGMTNISLNTPKDTPKVSDAETASEDEAEDESSTLLPKESTPHKPAHSVETPQQGTPDSQKKPSYPQQETLNDSLSSSKSSVSSIRPGTVPGSTRSLPGAEDSNQTDGPCETEQQIHSKPAGRLRRSYSKSEADVTKARDLTVRSTDQSKSEADVSKANEAERKDESSDSEETILKYEDLNLDWKTKKAMMEHTIDSSTPMFVEHLDPKPLCDYCHQKKEFLFISIRDIEEEAKTSDKNRAILKLVRGKDWETYVQFKICLKESKQWNCIRQLQLEEKTFLEERRINLGNTVSTDVTSVDEPSGEVDSEDEGSKPASDSELSEGPADGGAGCGDGDTAVPACRPEHGRTEDPAGLASTHSCEQEEENAKELLRQLESTETFAGFQLVAQKIQKPKLKVEIPSIALTARAIDVPNCPVGFQAHESSGRCNSCFYQSISILLFGDEGHYLRLRLLAALSAAENAEDIIQEMKHLHEHKTRDEVARFFSSMIPIPNEGGTKEQMIESCVQTIIRETAAHSKDSCLMHVLFLCRALGRSIKSHYQTFQDDLLNTTVAADGREPLNIMWVNSSNNTGRAPNHVVPLVKIGDTCTQEDLQPRTAIRGLQYGSMD